tara:strand:- start:27455 stop:27763 length:309 start_codon:yes stop_codon:yes gene_type:complete
MPPALQLPAAATPVAAAQRSSAHPPPVPAAPSAVAGNAFQGVPATNLINAGQSIGLDESYGNDETVLNDFLKLHPMLRYIFHTLTQLTLACSALQLLDLCGS